MSAYNAPTIILHTLSTADGSVTYTSASSTHTLTAGVNYPLEVPYRSDEDPESTYIEVSVRPNNAVSMVRERYIEDVVRRTLKTIVLGEDTPRCMLQITVQIVETEQDESLPGGVKGGYQGEGCLDLIVGSVNASVAGCLDGAVRMKGFLGAALIGILVEDGRTVTSPNVRERKRCKSLFAFGFNSHRQCVLMESEGVFDMQDWERAEHAARLAVHGPLADQTTSAPADTDQDDDDDVDMNVGEPVTCLFDAIRKSVEVRAARDERWKA